MPKNNTRINSFQHAVESTPDVADAYRSGLQALGKYSSKVSAKNSLLIDGSVDLDKATLRLYPNENRWDYAVCYDNKVYFVEVHSGNTSDVDVVLRKLQWLKQWLKNKATKIDAMKSETPYFWITVKGYNISKTSHQFRKLAESKLAVVRELTLPSV